MNGLELGLRSLSEQERERLASAVAGARHDVGKYVTFQQRWLGDGGSLEELRLSLQADLAATWRRGDDVVSAPGLWARHRPLLVEVGGGILAGEPEVARVDRSMERIAALLPRLSTAERGDLVAGRAAALEVSDALMNLHRRVREALRS